VRCGTPVCGMIPKYILLYGRHASRHPVACLSQPTRTTHDWAPSPLISWFSRSYSYLCVLLCHLQALQALRSLRHLLYPHQQHPFPTSQNSRTARRPLEAQTYHWLYQEATRVMGPTMAVLVSHRGLMLLLSGGCLVQQHCGACFLSLLLHLGH
jgi:hypothetical protein